MSGLAFLAPWFLLGALAVAIPIVLHLRRPVRQDLPFSSLRFLAASPPRLAQRRRIDQWLLLVLRGLVVLLLAAAFARPLFTRPLPLVQGSGVRRLVLLDTSASMRRAGVWTAALEKTRALVKAAGPGDRLAIMTFSDRAQLVLGFEEWAAERGAAEARLLALAPGWGGTDLGAALVAAAEVVADDSGQGLAAAQMVVLISDLAEGARLGALGPRDWPADLGLQLEKVGDAGRTNVGLAPVPEADGTGAAGALRVRVTASGPSAVEARLRWENGAAVPVALAPGESRVVEAPAPPVGPATLVLEGDDEPYDNRLAVAPVVPVRSAIVYVGEDGAEEGKAGRGAAGGFYFLSRAFQPTRARAPEVVAFRPGDRGAAAAVARADLVVVAVSSLPGELAGALRGALAAGRSVVFVPPDAGGARVLEALTGATVPAWSEAGGREAVLTAVERDHPLLQAFADKQVADFTRIRFWHHRVVDLAGVPGVRVLARFDDGSAAWALVPVGRGQIFVMTSGFVPRDSQLGLSSKLVPLLFGLLDASGGAAADLTPRFVGDVLPVPPQAVVLRPDGARGAGNQVAEQPGLYHVMSGAREGGQDDRWIAVNVPPAESKTAPLPLEELERLGLPAGEAGAVEKGRGGAAAQQTPRVEAAAERTVEEAAQRPWRFVLLAVLALAVAEAAVGLRGTRLKEAA